MDLSAFIEETLVGLKSGIEAANKNADQKSDQFRMMRDDRIDFDVALEVVEKKGREGGAKIGVASIISGGGSINAENQNTHTSRIKFSIKVKWNEFGWTDRKN